jgi:hypothetical protein
MLDVIIGVTKRCNFNSLSRRAVLWATSIGDVPIRVATQPIGRAPPPEGAPRGNTHQDCPGE